MATADELALRDRIIGLLLRSERERAKMTKPECAKTLGVTVSTITAYEEGGKAISLPELEVLAYALKAPIARLLAAQPEPAEEVEQPSLHTVLVLRHKIVGALVRQARVDAGLSQEELAAVVGCSVNRITSYEYGDHPIPLSHLELMAKRLRLPIEHFLDRQDGPVGEWHRHHQAVRRFSELPREVQDFIVRHSNIRYLEVAMKLAEMPAGALRDIAEGILEITY